LTGTDMSQWAGKRVQIVGSVAPAAAGTSPSPTGAATSATADAAAPLEFKVQSVQAASGSCPQQ